MFSFSGSKNLKLVQKMSNRRLPDPPSRALFGLPLLVFQTWKARASAHVDITGQFLKSRRFSRKLSYSTATGQLRKLFLPLSRSFYVLIRVSPPEVLDKSTMSIEHVSSLSEFQTILRTSGRKLVVVDFHATWCGPCVAIAPFYERLARSYDGRARFLKVDVDQAEDVARHCSVSSMPTFHMYLDGRMVSSFSGADQRRLQADVERYAPSTADVSFATSGQRLGDGGGSSSRGAASNRSNREIAAAAALKRMQKDPQTEAAPSKPAARDGEDLPADDSTTQKNDSRLKVDQVLLKQLVDEMGFPTIRAEKALILTGNKGVEPAVEWCFEHADDDDIDEPLEIVAQGPKLRPEEAKKKAEELRNRARAKRSEEEKQDAIKREKDRIKSGKEVTEAKQKYEDEARKRAIAEKKREKMEAKAERQRVRDMLEADKQRRRERFAMPGSGNSPPAPRVQERAPPKPRTPPAPAGGKIQFRFPDGSRFEIDFGPEQTMSDLVKALCDAKPELNPDTLTFSQQYPRKTFTRNEYILTLVDLGLLPRGCLTVSY